MKFSDLFYDTYECGGEQVRVPIWFYAKRYIGEMEVRTRIAIAKWVLGPKLANSIVSQCPHCKVVVKWFQD